VLPAPEDSHAGQPFASSHRGGGAARGF
jgi:hypothetical protein